MTEKTDQAFMDEAEMIAVLHRVAKDGSPPFHHGIESVLAAGRRARRRRRALMLPAGSLALIGVAALVFAIARVQTNDRQLFLSPASSSPSTPESPGPQEQAEINEQVLREALGDDFVISREGDVTVRPRSPSAEGLPRGLAVYTQLLVGVPSTELEQFCAPMVEKNVVFSACTQQTLPGGQTIHLRQSRTGLGGAKLGNGVQIASDGVRVLFEQSDGNLVIVDLSTQEGESSSTRERRAAARAWLDRMTSRLATAATDPRVRDTGSCHQPPKTVADCQKPASVGPR